MNINKILLFLFVVLIIGGCDTKFSLNDTTWTSDMISDGNFQYQQVISFSEETAIIIVKSLDGVNIDTISYPYTVIDKKVTIDEETGNIDKNTLDFGGIVFRRNM
ncbi:MAG: hypothetical protein LBS97_02875 [Treponema sp.]|jgi:hypothetical protein|nr:hypothetical protein [Treponema sp.]